jgi:hypothetical protein
MSVEPEASLPLIGVAREFYERYGATAPSYQTLWLATATGRLPAFRRGRTLHVYESDLPVFIAYFRLERCPEPADSASPTPAPTPDTSAAA